MRFTLAACVLSSVIAPIWAVSLKCVPSKVPYCCVAAASVPQIDVAVGVECTKQPIGHVPQCVNDQVKVCCSKHAVDIAGLVTLCELPTEVLDEVGGLLGGTL